MLRSDSSAIWHASAAVLYLAAALWTLRVVLPAPAELLPTEVRKQPQLVQLARYDESMVLSVVIRNAETLLRAPGELLEVAVLPAAQAAHARRAHVRRGALATVPYLLTRDPVLTYNVVLLLSIWIAGVAMYAFVFDLVRRPGPALVAGFVFALTPDRVWDVIHPFVHGDHWTPLAALCLRRVFAHGRVTATLGAALFCGLALLESFYAIVASGVVLATYSIHLAWAYRDRLLRRLPLLLAILAALAAVGWLVFAPYLETQEAFGVLGGRGAKLRRWWSLPLTQTAVVLAVLALLDRLRGRRPRDGDDPRWAFLATLLVALWFGAPAIPLPGFLLPSPVLLLAEVVPGFDAVRAPGAMGLGAWLAVAVLAGYGTLALTERLPALARAAVTVVLAGLILFERGVPAVATALLGQNLELAAWKARPSDEELRLLRATKGPILYLPIATRGAKGLVSADYLRLTSYAPRPTSACYNSFGSPFVRYLAALGDALPDPAAADALHALGFRTVVLDAPAYWPPHLRRFETALARQRGRRLVAVGRTDRLWAFHLKGRPDVRRNLGSLAAWERPARDRPAQVAPAGGRATLELRLKNRSAYPFVHPEPLLPSDVVLRWVARSGTARAHRLRTLLPLALLPGAGWTLAQEVDVPADAGVYDVTLHPAATPRLVLAAETVEAR